MLLFLLAKNHRKQKFALEDFSEEIYLEKDTHQHHGINIVLNSAFVLISFECGAPAAAAFFLVHADDLSYKSACSGDHVNLAGYLRTASLVWIILES
jgi:hypothetical protein